MQITVRQDSVEIDGYVNAIERLSRPIKSRLGQFRERVCKDAFKRAIARNDNIRLLLNHNWDKDLGGTKDGNLELTEDNIGLRARAIITDPETVKKARNGELVGWSFGFQDRDVESLNEGDLPTRAIKDLDLFEVSLLDRSRTPAYDGTLVTVRSEDDVQWHGEAFITEIQVREIEETVKEEKKEIDYSKYDALIAELKED